MKRGKSRLKPLSAKKAAAKSKYARVCKEIDEDMYGEYGYIHCTSCGERDTGLNGMAHSHNLPKSQYPQHEVSKWNISPRCLDCHRSLDNHVFEDIQYFKDLDDIMTVRTLWEPLAYNRFVTGLREVGCEKFNYINE